MKLKVWHKPQIPCASFEVEVASLREAVLLLDSLSRYDQFQLEHSIRPDFASGQGLLVFDPDDTTDSPAGSWSTWYSEDGRMIDQLEELDFSVAESAALCDRVYRDQI